MPKHRKKKKRSKQKDPDQAVFNTTFRFNGTAAASNTALTPTITVLDYAPSAWGARGVAFADLYQKYRIVGFRARFHMHPAIQLSTVATQTYGLWMPGNCSWYAGVYYGPSSTFTAPTTVANFLDFPHLTWRNDNHPGTMSLRVTRGDLKKHMKQPWLQTVLTGETNPDFTQICFMVLSLPRNGTSSAAAIDWIIDLDVEFTGSVDPALIPKIMFERYLSYDEEEKKEVKT